MTKKALGNPLKRVFYFVAEIGSLMFMPRTHTRSLINNFDNVASHSHHTAVIAYCLARMEELSHEEGLKAMAMGLFHDSAEARTGDMDFPAKHYATTDESLAFAHQFANLPFGDDLKKLIDEFEDRETLAAKCAKDADTLEQLYQEWMLTHLGNKLAERWYKGDYKNRVPHLRTKSAQKIALQMRKHQPHDWWWEDMIDKSFKIEHLNSKK